MRTFLLVITLMSFISGCKSSIDDKSKRNAEWGWWIDDATGKGEWIKLGNKTNVLNGTITSFYFNGNIADSARIKNGKPVDTTYRYDINGKLDSYFIFYGDSMDYYFINNGPFEKYDRDGTLHIKGIVQNHLDEDVWLMNKNGKPLFDRDVRGDSGYYFAYYESGKLKMSSKGKFIARDYVKNIRGGDTIHRTAYNRTRYNLQNGLKVTYYETGGVEDSVNYVNGLMDGVAITRFVNGNIRTHMYYIANMLNGEYVSYYENGQKKYSGYFKNDQAEGIGYTWYENGNLSGKSNFLNGELNGVQHLYHENGKKKGVMICNNGSVVKTLEMYDTTGKLIVQ